MQVQFISKKTDLLKQTIVKNINDYLTFYIDYVNDPNANEDHHLKYFHNLFHSVANHLY